MASPLVALDPAGQPSIISYNLPEPTSYSGRITLGLTDLPLSYFKPVPPSVLPVFDIVSITQAMKNGFDNQDMFADLGIPAGELRYVEGNQGFYASQRIFDEQWVNWNDGRGLLLASTLEYYYVIPYTGMICPASLRLTENGYLFSPLPNRRYIPIVTTGGDNTSSGTIAPVGSQVAVEYNVRRRSYRTPPPNLNSRTTDPAVLMDPLLTQSILDLNPMSVQYNLNRGLRLRIRRDEQQRYVASWVPLSLVPRIAIMERLRLSSFHGNYGAGRVVKTFSLLPGEKTTITIKSYLRTSQSRKETSSILDSYTQSSADDFSDALSRENADRAERKESQSWHVEAEAESDWGFVAVQASAGYKGGSSQANEQFTKNLTTAVSKHASLASSKRDIKIDQSEETTTATGEETGVQRVIQNINTGRTLNFVFRQLNQEFISILHLVDVQVAYYNGAPNGLKLYSLGDLDAMLKEAIVDGPSTDIEQVRKLVKARIVSELSYILDYKGSAVRSVESRNIVDGSNNVVRDEQGNPRTYYRARTDMVSKYPADGDAPLASGKSFRVPGVILAVSTNILRTSGLIAEALLGQGEGLDSYSLALQQETSRRQQLQNDLQSARNSHDALVLGILNRQDTAAAVVYAQVYPKAQPAPAK